MISFLIISIKHGEVTAGWGILIPIIALGMILAAWETKKK